MSCFCDICTSDTLTISDRELKELISETEDDPKCSVLGMAYRAAITVLSFRDVEKRKKEKP